MEGDRIRQALARIEAASRRIEAAAARRPSSPSPASSDLEQRHAALRREASAALADLDRLIEGMAG